MLKQIAAVLIAGWALGVSADQYEFDFSKDTIDQRPRGFASEVTGPGAPASWKVVNESVPPLLASLESTAPANTTQRPVLAVQSYNFTPEHCPVLLCTNEIFDDFTLTTRFKISGGVVEPSAGLVFRAKDGNNYYALRASTEGNLLWYKVVDGHAYENLGIGVRVPIAKNAWRELRVVCLGSQMRCFLDGRLVIPPVKPGAPTDDVAINDTTFARGFVGFWTKADTKCSFVDARVVYSPRVPYVQVVIHNVLKEYPSLLGLKVYADKMAGQPVIIGDVDEKELGRAGTKTEQDVIDRASVYYLKDGKAVEVTMPLRDRNGDVAAAVKIRMKSFRGETQNTAITHATLIRKYFEQQIAAQDIKG
jgi:hypothetical protein